MSWNSWSDFWAMGGYGFYVWGSFSVTALALIAETALLAARRRSLRDNDSTDYTGDLPHEA